MPPATRPLAMYKALASYHRIDIADDPVSVEYLNLNGTQMAGLQCVCGGVSQHHATLKQWGILVISSAIAHVMLYCGGDECDSDDNGGPDALCS